MAEVATMILSPFLEAFFRKLASGEFKDFFQRRKLSDELVENLKTAFLTVSAVIEDAEELVVTKPAVKDWLDDLKDAVYDAERILDEIATEALQSKLHAESRSKTSKLLKPIFTSGSSFVKEIEPKIDGVLKRVNTLIGRISAFGLKEGLGVRPSDRITTSLVEESGICGRDNEKEEIIKMLLSDDARDNETGVVAIVGMGGLGKTTLAQLVFNDDRVKEHFNCHAWVCVSDQFDPLTITKTILSKVALSTSDDKKDLDGLQSTLKQTLTGKKFLFVLDDVWNEKHGDWEALSKPFRSGVKGNRIIVTTRNKGVASTVCANPIYHLQKLAEIDCSSLFIKYAFNNDESSADPELKKVGEQILKKCDGLPLAIKTIGAVLRSKLDIDEWDKILKSDLWDLPMGEVEIIPALKLSYKYLPSQVKRCFAYCSIFPKDYLFGKNRLILFWMGEGFLHESRYKTMEEVGNEYFTTLVSRSFFQQSSDDQSLFIMHDLVNDLATFVCGKITMRLEDNLSHENLSKIRHLSYGMEEFDCFKKFESFQEAKNLCTFMPLELSYEDEWYLHKSIFHELLPTLTSLRVLSLSNYKNVTELPGSIEKVKHLRYLDLSSTRIRKLPNSICDLCNLQVLNLSKCEKLVELPKEMWQLVMLRHLDFSGTGIKEMPVKLGKLKCLQTLTQFIIGRSIGCGITELGELKNLRGSLSIVGLQNIESPNDAWLAKLSDKQHLQELELEWNIDNGTDILESQSSVLDNFQPHTNLRRLSIKNYLGRRFPKWLGQSLISKLASVQLENCKNCSKLPSLGQLPFLERLSIIGLDEVVEVGDEFNGSVHSGEPFKALKILKFKKMAKWEKWVSFGGDENGGKAFPQLEKLYIKSCPELREGLPVHLPRLAQLEIDECPQLMAPIPRAPTIRELALYRCNQFLLKDLPVGVKTLKIEELDAPESLPSTLEELVIFRCDKVESLFKGMINHSWCLSELKIYGCSSLESFPKDGLPSTIKKLEISDCYKLECLPEGMIDSNIYLENLQISGCHSMRHLSKGGLPSTTKELTIIGCNKLECLPEGMIDSNIYLEKLDISHCRSMKYLSKGGLPSTLKYLDITGCEELEVPTNVEYPFLEGFYLWRCHSVKTVSLDLFPNLDDIRLNECDSLESLTVSENCKGDLAITDISIQGCPKFVSFPKGGLRAPKLRSLEVSSCKTLRSLPDRMHILVPSLESLSLSNCPELESLPEGGLPSSLKSIRIGYKFAGSRMGWGLRNLTSVRNLSINGYFDSEDVSSFPAMQLLPSTLTDLFISGFRNLKSLGEKGLQHLTALKTFHIWNCPKLKDIAKQRLPPTLSFLQISDCPLLAEQCQSKKGKKWRKIPYIREIKMNGELIE